MNYRSSSALLPALVLIITISALSLLISPGKAAQPLLETIQLSDLTQTNGGAYDQSILAAANSIHVFWKEETGTNEGYDLFYRELPSGNTINLSDHTLTESNIGTWEAQLSNDGSVAVIWSEETPAGNSDLFFWRNSNQQLLNLSSTASTMGNTSPYLYHLLLDSNGKAHVLWVEEPTTAPLVQDLYYWNEATGVTQILSPSGTTSGVGGAIVSEVEATLVNDILYVSWSEYVGPDQTLDPFFWDSSSQNRVNLSNLTDSFSSPESLQMVATPTNEAHVFWLENVSASSTNKCPFYWNSTIKVTESLIANASDCQTHFIESNQNNGQVHVTWDNSLAIFPNVGLYYRDISSSTTMTLSETIQDIEIGFNTPYLLDPVSGKVHLSWIENTSSEGLDVFYWNSVDQTVQNISDHALTSSSRAEDMIKLVDSTGVLHIFWLETADNTTEFEDLFYWNSQDQNTIHLSDPALVTGDARTPVAVLDSNDDVHVIWRELEAGTNNVGLYYWNSISSETKALPVVPNGGFNINYDMAVDTTDTIHVAWSVASGVTAEGANMYYWDGADDSTDISDVDKTQGDSGVPIITINGMNQVFITWLESDDLFGAFEPINLPYNTYLPLVSK